MDSPRRSSSERYSRSRNNRPANFPLHFSRISFIIQKLSGCGPVGRALDLGAGIPNPEPTRKDRKQPHISGKFPLYPPLKVGTIYGRISLTTYLTTTEKISGLSEVWYRAWFGTKRPWVRIPQPGPEKLYGYRQLVSIELFLFLDFILLVEHVSNVVPIQKNNVIYYKALITL